jgi:hypothetical protein
MESLGEDGCRHVAFRKTLPICGRQQLRKTIPILRSGVHNALCYETANHRHCYAQNGCRLPVSDRPSGGTVMPGTGRYLRKSSDPNKYPVIPRNRLVYPTGTRLPSTTARITAASPESRPRSFFMAWRSAMNSPGFEYPFTGTECFSNASSIFRTSSRRKKKHRAGKFRSGPFA